MKDKTIKSATFKLINQAFFLHAMRKYKIDETIVLPILGETIEKYSSEKHSLMKNIYAAGVKRKIDIETMTKMMLQIRSLSDDELNSVANAIYSKFKAFSLIKKDEVQLATEQHNERKLNDIAKKNNAYIYLCEGLSDLTIERIKSKGNISLLSGMSTGVLKFILKTAIQKKSQNIVRCNLDDPGQQYDLHALKENSFYQQIIDQIKSILTVRNQITSDGALQEYEQMIKQEELARFEY